MNNIIMFFYITECTNGKRCGHLCLNAGDDTGVCECSQGYYLQLDGISCESKLYNKITSDISV